jgi:hypothetical protein
MARHRAAAASIVATTLVLFAACDDGAVARPCSNIPAGGCPISRGVACEDPACEAVYACRPGDVWELQERCPARDAGPSETNDAAPVEPDAGSPVGDAAIDAPPGAYGGPGCDSLQAPDCALGVALACGADCCGCEDLYICEDNGWTLWGGCGPSGPTPDP